MGGAGVRQPNHVGIKQEGAGGRSTIDMQTNRAVGEAMVKKIREDFPPAEIETVINLLKHIARFQPRRGHADWR
jgi:hypothetical protein